jgi:2-keto-3-deoxy-L-rhamnonate aldolase RhmA
MRANEILRNAVKEKLARNELVASMTVRLVRGIEIARIAPFVRVPGNAPETMSRVLDGGGLLTRPKLAAEFVAMGACMISTGTDIQFLLAAATEKARQVHEIPV